MICLIEIGTLHRFRLICYKLVLVDLIIILLCLSYDCYSHTIKCTHLVSYQVSGEFMLGPFQVSSCLLSNSNNMIHIYIRVGMVLCT